jgi:replication factor C small subunit
MDAPLWTDVHAPSLEEIPQADVRDHLHRGVEQPINLVVHGPAGSGKTAAVRAMAREAHADPENDLIEINVADVFDRTKSEITDDPRFAPFLEGRSDLSKRDMLNHVLKESASYAPVSGDYKTLLLDNAEAIREDFQQALRRVMERHYRTTQFVITTRQPTKLIPPIRSRCFPVPVRAPTDDEVVGVLARIAEAEGVEYDTEGLRYVATVADGDLREAILGAQTTAAKTGAITGTAPLDVLREVGDDDRIESMIEDAVAGEFDDARSTLDDLLVDEGRDGEVILEDLLRVARKREFYDDADLAALHRLAADVEMDLSEGANDRIHLSHLLAELGRDGDG